MKKLLALVLALVMVLGLATVSTSAAYSDQDDINYEEAVAVMTAIGVFQGKGSNFDPKANLNRAEAAKIVAYLMLGNKTAENLKGIGTKFTDVPASHWAAGYIEYLASVGIVSGVGGGRFDPNGQVTAVQLAKMLLVALGYDANIEGFVGSDWAINIQSMANKVGIYDGNKGVLGTAPVTRDEAALYAFNTIKSPLVEYEEKGNKLSINGAELSFGASNAKYMTTTGNNKTQTIDKEKVNGTDAYIVEFAEQYYPDLKYVNYGNSTNDFGEPTHKWTNKNIDVGEFTVKEDLLETYTVKVTAKMLYELLGQERYDSIVDDSTTLTVYVDGVQTARLGGTTGTGSTESKDVDPYINRNNTTKVNGTGNGSVTKVYVDDDNNVTLVTYHTYVYQAAGDYDTSKESLNIKEAGNTEIVLDSTSISVKDFPQIADYKDDDYLLVTAYHMDHDAAKDYDVATIEKAEILTGTVENYKVEDSVTIDGTSYKYGTTTKANGDGPKKEAVKSTSYTVGKKASVVLDKYSYIVAIDEAVVAENYVYIATLGRTSTVNAKVVADAYFTDGTNKEITIEELNGVTSTEKMLDNGHLGAVKAGAIKSEDHLTNCTNGGWFSFSVDDDGEYTLYALTAKQGQEFFEIAGADANGYAVTSNDRVKFMGAHNTKIDKSETTFNFDGNKNYTYDYFKANDKTIVVVEYDGDVYTYTGVKNVPDITVYAAKTHGTSAVGKAIMSVVYDVDNMYAKYVFVTVEGDADVSDSAIENMIYILKADGQYYIDKNKTYFKYKILDGDSATVNLVEATKDFTLGGTTYEAYNKVRVNSDGRYTKATPVRLNLDGNKYVNITSKALTEQPVSYSGDTLTIGKVGYTLASDAKITLIVKKAANVLNKDKAEDYEVSMVSASTLASKLNKDNYPNLYYSAQLRLTNKDDLKIAQAFVTVEKDTSNQTAISFALGTSGTALPKVADSHVAVSLNSTAKNATTDAAATTITKGSSNTVSFVAQGGYTISKVEKKVGNAKTEITSFTTSTSTEKTFTETVNASTEYIVTVVNPYAVTLTDGATKIAAAKAITSFRVGSETAATDADTYTALAGKKFALGSSQTVVITPNDGIGGTKARITKVTLNGTDVTADGTFANDDGTGAWTYALTVGAANTFAVTTADRVAVTFYANKAATVSVGDNSYEIAENAHDAIEIDKSTAVTFAVDWDADVQTWEQAAAIKSSDNYVATNLTYSRVKDQYTIAAAGTAAAVDVYLGAVTKNVTISETTTPGYATLTWAGNSATGTAMHWPVNNGIAVENGDEIAVPVGAQVVIKYSGVENKYAKINVLTNKATLTGSDDAWVITNGIGDGTNRGQTKYTTRAGQTATFTQFTMPNDTMSLTFNVLVADYRITALTVTSTGTAGVSGFTAIDTDEKAVAAGLAFIDAGSYYALADQIVTIKATGTVSTTGNYTSALNKTGNITLITSKLTANATGNGFADGGDAISFTVTGDGNVAITCENWAV